MLYPLSYRRVALRSKGYRFQEAPSGIHRATDPPPHIWAFVARSRGTPEERPFHHFQIGPIHKGTLLIVFTHGLGDDASGLYP